MEKTTSLHDYLTKKESFKKEKCNSLKNDFYNSLNLSKIDGNGKTTIYNSYIDMSCEDEVMKELFKENNLIGKKIKSKSNESSTMSESTYIITPKFTDCSKYKDLFENIGKVYTTPEYRFYFKITEHNIYDKYNAYHCIKNTVNKYDYKIKSVNNYNNEVLFNIIEKSSMDKLNDFFNIKKLVYYK